MKNIYGFSIFFTLVGLWITTKLPVDLEPMLGFIFILSFGMIHGSNDIMIINQFYDSSKTQFLKNLFIYLSIVSFAVIVFYFFPVLALGLFVLFSAYHFGEQHLQYTLLSHNVILKKIFFFSYGLLILFMIFNFQKENVFEIIYQITSYKLKNIFALEVIIILLIILIILTSHATYNKSIKYSYALRELFSLLVLGIVFKVSTLIWSFTIYFIFWHSIPSLMDQITFIYGDLNKNSVLKYIKAALPYWLISLFGITLLFLIFKNEKHFHSLFFAFIAAVTFPHAVVMLKMFTKKRT